MLPSSQPDAAPLLSVVMPVFNEAGVIDCILAAVLALDLVGEVIVVDDCSTDGTRDRLQALAGSDHRLRIMYHERNQGKGAALRTGFTAATGRFAVIQDADLEYDPREFPKLLQPLLDDEADVVFGSRFNESDCERVFPLSNAMANRVLTRISNTFTRLHLTDLETCYKVFPLEIMQDIAIEENGFGFEPEITAKLARYRRNGQRLRIREIGISYRGRTYGEGKKIGWKDGLWTLWCIVKYNWL